MARHAVLVGINDYGGAGNLRGCINDVTNMRHILKTYFGFENADIRVVIDERATKENIEIRLEQMVERAQRGDHLVFHFSGHGSQIRDRGEQDELLDHMDELLCPHDMDWDGNFIIDDQLREIFGQLPKGVMLEVFLDCCHSGTGLRSFNFGRPPELGPESEHPTLSRFLPPPVDIECRIEGDTDEVTEVRKFSTPNAVVPSRVLWAGCQDHQTSADAYIDGDYNGAFTYYFCKHMRDTGSNISRYDLLKRVRASLQHGNYSQIPQLECEESLQTANPLSLSLPKKSKQTRGK